MAVEDSWQSLATVIPSSSPAPGHPDGRRELGEEGVGSEERSHPGSGTDGSIHGPKTKSNAM